MVLCKKRNADGTGAPGELERSLVRGGRGMENASASLRRLRVSELKLRAREAGVREEQLDNADDSADVKAALIRLIDGMGGTAVSVQELDGLFALPVSALRRRAISGGATQEELDDADDGPQTKEDLIGLLVRQAAAAGSSSSPVSAVPESPDAGRRAQRVAELQEMKISQLRRTAAAAGASDRRLESATDASDVKGALVELIMEAEASEVVEPSQTAAEDSQLARLQAELQGLGLMACWQRAESVGVDEHQLAQALDKPQPKPAVIKLVLAAQASQPDADSGLRSQLEAMSLVALYSRAVSADADAAAVERAMDSATPKEQMVALLLRHRSPPTAVKPLAQPQDQKLRFDEPPKALPKSSAQKLPRDDEPPVAARGGRNQKRPLSASRKGLISSNGNSDAARTRKAPSSSVAAESGLTEILSVGGEESCSLLLSVFQYAIEVVDSLLSTGRAASPAYRNAGPNAATRFETDAGTRANRQAMMNLMDRLELVVEAVDVDWCDNLRQCSFNELNTFSVHLEATQNLKVADGSDRIQAILTTLLYAVHRCSSVVIQSTAALMAVDVSEDTRLRALETLRSLPEELLTEPSQEELLAFGLAGQLMSVGSQDGSDIDRPTQLAAAMASFTLGCRNGADACAAPEMLAHVGELWVQSLRSLVISMDDLDVASAVLSMVALLHAETPAKLPPSVRAPLEMQNLSSAKNAFVFMGKELSVATATEVVKTMLERHLLAQEDVSLSCGAAYLAAFLLTAKLEAVEPCSDSHLFQEVLALHRRVCAQNLSAQWWAVDGSIISNTSTRLVGVGFLAQHAKSVAERVDTDWWEPLLEGAVHMVKMNASAQLCAQDTMSFWPILSSLGIVEAAAKDLSQHKFLLGLGVGEALEYAGVNDFVFTGRSIANVAAGAMVALVGRNEGGKTLNKDTVDAVLNFLALYFQPDHPAYTRPATTVILPLTTVVTMVISDVNKLLMLQHEALLETLIECLILDGSNHRKGQKGVDAMQEAATGILLALALFGPGAEALRKHAQSVGSLQQLLALESDVPKQALKNASCALFQLNEVPRGGPRPIHKARSNNVKDMGDAAIELVRQGGNRTPHVMMSYNWDHQEVRKRSF